MKNIIIIIIIGVVLLSNSLVYAQTTDPLIELGSINMTPKPTSEILKQTYYPPALPELNQQIEPTDSTIKKVGTTDDGTSILDFGFTDNEDKFKQEININETHFIKNGEYHKKTETYLAGFDNEKYDTHHKSSMNHSKKEIFSLYIFFGVVLSIILLITYLSYSKKSEK